MDAPLVARGGAALTNQFLALSEPDRRLAFDNAAVTLQLSPVILEKDFWVSWLLGLLFSQPEWAGQLVFKGGTSLSKVFGVIDRFSEDIDLSLQPAFVGADGAAFDALQSLTDQQPTGVHAVRPLVAKSYEALFADWQCDVVALALERTFWEKATILHAEFHRPEGSVMPDRYARHYFDMVMLLQHSQGQQMLANVAQCQRVVDWKSKVFARAWARYDLAQPGTFRLVPPSSRQAGLAQDYSRMQPMFMSQPPSFAELMMQLASAEEQLNQV